MSLIASVITKSCFAWILFYVCVGSSQGGKDFIVGFLSNFTEDTKAGVPLMMLTYPVLIAASFCALLGVRSSRRFSLCAPKLFRRRVGLLRSFFQGVLSSHGDGNFDFYALLFLLLPFLLYVALGIHRHASKQEVNLLKLVFGRQSLDEETAADLTMGVGNVFGMVAVVALGLFLVPASKHGPIMKVLGWSHAVAIRLHIWCGWAIVVASFVHGLCYYYSWKYQYGEDYRTFWFPPRECWTRQEDFTPRCKSGEDFCSCYDLFLYFTGTIAELFLAVIVITSSNWVRRKAYNLFLTSHLLASPLFCIALMFHYNSAILYMSPSILYYIATTIPPYLERSRNVGVQVVSIEVIGTISKYLSITVEATRETVQAYRPGMYTNLSVPSISSVAHPLTVVRVPGKDDQLRIIFQVVGPFTRQLAMLLEAEAGIPTIHLDGLHGPPNRLQQLRRHDVNILVAGGIGVTPFLSLLGDAVEANDGSTLSQPCSSGTKRLSFHWMCRDASLIEYVRKQYLGLLDGRATPTCDTQIHIYQTDSRNEISIRTLLYPTETSQVCEPFRLSRFASSKRLISNVGPFLALSVIFWPCLAIILYCFRNLQPKGEMKGRGMAAIGISLYTLIVSYFLARVLPYHWFGKSSTVDFKMMDASDHSYEETLPLSLSLSAGQVSQTIDDESPHHVTTECHSGRPDMEIIVEAVDDARWPAIFSCGPASLSENLRIIANEKSKARNAVEPSRSSPLVTIYNEVFLM